MFFFFSCPVAIGIDRDGCSLSGVSARCHWEERRVTGKMGSAWRSAETEEDDDDGERSAPDDDSDDGDDVGHRRRRHGQESDDDEEEGADEDDVMRRVNRLEAGEIWPIRRLSKGVHVTLNLEAASLIGVVLR